MDAPIACCIDAQARTKNTHAAHATLFVTQGQGLSPRQVDLCDGTVYIPQHGVGTASLNVTVAASIVLHHFAIWAGYPETPRCGAKYDVAPPPRRTMPRGTLRLGTDGGGTTDGAGGEQWLEDAMAQHGGVEALLDALAADSQGQEGGGGQ